jgi:DNA-directed RNA polymerase specialized sigma24 family protein
VTEKVAGVAQNPTSGEIHHPPLTDRILNIPKVVARRYAKLRSELYEELVSLGNEVIVTYARKWRPDGGMKFDSYLMMAVIYKLREASGKTGSRSTKASRWRKTANLSDYGTDGKKTIGESLVDTDDSPTLDDRDAAEFLLGKLTALERLAIESFYGDRAGIEETARRIGRSRKSAGKTLKDARDKIDRHKRRLGMPVMAWERNTLSRRKESP